MTADKNFSEKSEKDESKQRIIEEVERFIEEKDINLSKEFCEIASQIIDRYEKFKVDMTKALNDYEQAGTKSSKNKAFKTVEDIYIDNRIYILQLKLPKTNYYLDNVSGRKYFNKVRRYNKDMYESLDAFKKELMELSFTIENIDKNINRKIEKEIERREQEQTPVEEVKGQFYD